MMMTMMMSLYCGIAISLRQHTAFMFVIIGIGIMI